MLPTTTLYTQIQEKSKYLRDPSLRWKIECLLRGLKQKNRRLTCATFGIHRSTFYRWLHRLIQKSFAPEALQLKSRRPHHSPRQLNDARLQRILWYRETFHYGAGRIAWYLEQENLLTSAHAVHNALKRAGVALRRRRDQKPNTHTKRYDLDRPGQGLQLDIKYVPYPIENQPAYVFNAIDDCSRFRFQWLYRNKGYDEACDFVQRLVKAAPFKIERIQTDNDVAFTDRFLRTAKVAPARLHPFTALLTANGIRHKLLPPGLKELNGKVERSHKTDDQEFYWRLSERLTLEEFQRELQRWTMEYNHYRPHTSLKMKTPGQRLRDFNIELAVNPNGSWQAIRQPTHYQRVIEQLRQYRALNPHQALIHWQFKAKKTQEPHRSPWLPGTPSVIKALSQMCGNTTGRRTGADRVR